MEESYLFSGRGIDEGGGLFVVFEQLPHFTQQVVIVTAGCVQVGRALLRRQFQRRMEDPLDLGPEMLIHGAVILSSVPCSLTRGACGIPKYLANS